MSTIVPFKDIPDDSLYNLVTAFVLREGTDYGEQEVELEVKVRQVIEALKLGRALVVFSEVDESFDIVSKESLTLTRDDNF